MKKVYTKTIHRSKQQGCTSVPRYSTTSCGTQRTHLYAFEEDSKCGSFQYSRNSRYRNGILRISNGKEKERELTRLFSEIKNKNVSSNNYIAIGILSAWLQHFTSYPPSSMAYCQSRQINKIVGKSPLLKELKFSDYALTDMQPSIPR